jgi:hypothetical protein
LGPGSGNGVKEVLDVKPDLFHLLVGVETDPDLQARLETLSRSDVADCDLIRVVGCTVGMADVHLSQVGLDLGE